MKILAAALIALGGLAATSTLAQAQDFDGHHRHHGPVVIVEHRDHHYRDRDRDHNRRHHIRPYHEYRN